MAIQLLKDLRPVARKQHMCAYCECAIEKGEKYVRQTLHSDEINGVYEWPMHEDCEKIVSVLDMSQLCADEEGVPRDSFQEIVNDAYEYLIETKEPQPERTLHEKVKYILEHQDELKN